MTAFSSGNWKPVRGAWTASIGGEKLSPRAACPLDGRLIRISVSTLCGDLVADMDGVPKEACPVEQFARQCQLAASAIHYGSRKCLLCLERFGWDLTPHERQFLYASDPTLGVALGLTVVKGGEKPAPRPRPNDMRKWGRT